MTIQSAFTILEDNTVELRLVTETLKDAPYLRQPHNPSTGEAFATREEAEAWAIEFIENRENPPAPVVIVDEPTDAVT
jgi:hypothetical protein